MSSHQPDRPASVNDDGLPRFYAGQFGGVPAGGENVGQHHIVVLFFLRIVREFQTIEVGVGHAQVFGLAAAVRSHPGETVKRAGPFGVWSKKKTKQATLPTLIRSTASPTSATRPRFSWPRTRPSSMSVRPSYMCRSEPQMLVLVIFTSTSVGRSIFASGTFFTRTSRGPL